MNANAPQASKADGPNSRSILLTGVTGFLGQAVLQALLESAPDVHVTALIRPKGSLTALDRVQRLLRKPVFASWIERAGSDAVGAALERQVSVIEGDLVDLPPLEDRYDVVIHSASSVSFNAPIDEAFRTNVGGAENLYRALLDSGQDPHVIHVSTAYVGGVSKGVRLEGRLNHDVDRHAEYAASQQSRARVEAESRTPERLREFMREARSRSSRMGPKAVAGEAEAARRAHVDARLVDFGRTRAESLGWTDVYTFTKAMAERAAEELWAEQGHRVSFVRPSIIESALRLPHPGWIDGYKVADPLIMAYARGKLHEFPGVADSVLDIIPVDFVVNVILALVAGDPRAVPDADGPDRDALPAAGAGAEYFHVVSGMTNPLPFHQMVTTVREYFLEHPLTDRDGTPIDVPEWTFPSSELIEQRLRLREVTADVGRKVVSRLPASRRTRAWAGDLSKVGSQLTTLRMFADLYRQYTKTEMVFDDAATRALLAGLPEGARRFDISEVEWDRYFKDVHLPALTELTKIRSRARAGEGGAPRQAADIRPAADALAVFDLDGTVISANIVQQYAAVVRATQPPYRWPAALAGLAGIVPGLLRAESRDRSELIRMVNRRYKGFRSEDLRELMAGELGDRIRASIRPQARQLIEEHRAAGHRTVLVTGALEVLVEPLADLFDDVVATRMDATSDGVFTGYLAASPLVDEARANWLHHYARSHGADLSKSTGYGDSLADAAWLQLVGEPIVVTPDLGLYSIALKKRWKVLEW